MPTLPDDESSVLEGGDTTMSASQSKPNPAKPPKSGDTSVGDMRDPPQQSEQAPENLEDKQGTTSEQRKKNNDPSGDEPVEEETKVSTARPVALSDSAIRDVDEDQLGFTPYVEAVAEFILAEQTKAPLALAINAPWGQGKTSFMNMIDAQLKREARHFSVKVATIWFNPWMYSQPEQVWGAFVANITRCLRANLPVGQRWKIRLRNLPTKLSQVQTWFQILRSFVALAFLLLIPTIILVDQASIAPLVEQNETLRSIHTAVESIPGFLGKVFAIVVVLLAILYAYGTYSKSLGVSFLTKIEQSDFKDKVGTLSQFEEEIRRLSEAVPKKKMKIVVFIDDLDRCKGNVLGEIIEALQLVDVSRSCIFVMGMDMQIVANTIESERQDLVHSVDDPSGRLEHSKGYKFLEKIIQIRLALPSYGRKQMQDLILTAMGGEASSDNRTNRDFKPGGGDEEGHTFSPSENESEEGLNLQDPSTQDSLKRDRFDQNRSRHEGVIENTYMTIRNLALPRREVPSDSQAITATARHYGSRHFQNPRRLKRFINGFRLHTYIASELSAANGLRALPPVLRAESTRTDRLARFLVLAEKWPALVQSMLDQKEGARFLDQLTSGKRNSKTTDVGIAEEIKRLPQYEFDRLGELLQGEGGKDPISYKDLNGLSDWYGFCYYRSIEPKSTNANSAA